MSNSFKNKIGQVLCVGFPVGYPTRHGMEYGVISKITINEDGKTKFTIRKPFYSRVTITRWKDLIVVIPPTAESAKHYFQYKPR